jgi:hypothetical protein
MEKDKDSFLTALQREILRHNFDTFVDNPPSVAQGGRGCVVPGCVPCRKRFQTTSEFLEHLAYDVLPAFMDRVRKRKRSMPRKKIKSQLSPETSAVLRAFPNLEPCEEFPTLVVCHVSSIEI